MLTTTFVETTVEESNQTMKAIRRCAKRTEPCTDAIIPIQTTTVELVKDMKLTTAHLEQWDLFTAWWKKSACPNQGDRVWRRVEEVSLYSTEQLASIVADQAKDSGRGFIIKDIVLRCAQHAQDVLEQLAASVATYRQSEGRHRQHTVFIAVQHEIPGWSHIHIYHNCTYAKSWCSWALLRNIPTGRERRRTVSTDSVSKFDWGRILLYLLRAGRTYLHLEVAGTTWTLARRPKHFSSSEVDEMQRPQTTLEGCSELYETVDRSRHPRGTRSLDACVGTTTSNNSAFAIPRGLPRHAGLLDIVRLFRDVLCSPVEKLVKTESWRSDLRY